MRLLAQPRIWLLLLAAATQLHAGAQAATISLTYDVVAAARDTTGNGAYSFFSNPYNGLVSRSNGAIVSPTSQSYSFVGDISGANTYFAGFPAQNRATVDAGASISFAALRASVYGTGSTTAQVVNVPGQNNIWAAIDGGVILGSAHDTLTLLSGSLPPGTPVQVEVGVFFHARTGMTGGPADPTVWPGFVQGAPTAQFSFGGATYLVMPWADAERSFTDSFVFDTTVGGTLALDSYLRVQGGLNALAPLGDINLGPYTDPSTSGFADASATALLSVRVLTQGVTYLAQSGTVYPTMLPVPEPPVLALMVVGIIWAALHKLRLRGA